jgi:serine/threonine protein kinase
MLRQSNQDVTDRKDDAPAAVVRGSQSVASQSQTDQLVESHQIKKELKLTPENLRSLIKLLEPQQPETIKLKTEMPLHERLKGLLATVEKKPLLTYEDHYLVAITLIHASKKLDDQVKKCTQFFENIGMPCFARLIQHYRANEEYSKELNFNVFIENLDQFDIHLIPIAPTQIDLKDLNDNGYLNIPKKESEFINDEIAKQIKLKKFTSQIDTELVEYTLYQFKKKPMCGVEFSYDAKTLEPIFIGYTHDATLGVGGNARVRIGMKKFVKSGILPNDHWYARKISHEPKRITPAKKEGANTTEEPTVTKKSRRKDEFAISQQMGIALTKAYYNRNFVENDLWFHEVTTMRWLPGEDLEKAFMGDIEAKIAPREFHPKFLMRILLNLCQAVLTVHNKGFLHCDIKPLNFMLFGVDVKAIDFGFSVEGTEYSYEGYQAYGTMGTVHPKVAKTVADKRLTLDIETDVYSLGVTMAMLLKLITPESEALRDEWQNKSFIHNNRILNFAEDGGYKLVQEHDKQFTDNPTHLPIPVLCDVRNFVNRMMGNQGKGGEKEPSIKSANECVQFFKQQCERKEMSDLPATAAIIDVTEYLKSPERIQSKMVAEAQKHAATRFIHTGKKPTALQQISIWRKFDAGRKTVLARRCVPIQDPSKDPLMAEQVFTGINLQYHRVTKLS